MRNFHQTVGASQHIERAFCLFGEWFPCLDGKPSYIMTYTPRNYCLDIPKLKVYNLFKLRNREYMNIDIPYETVHLCCLYLNVICGNIETLIICRTKGCSSLSIFFRKN